MTVYVDAEGTEYELDPGDECPLCMCGTLGRENPDEFESLQSVLVCRGECGNIFRSRERKFYKTVITVEVISDEPVTHPDLALIARQIDSGDCSGRVSMGICQTLNGKECVEALRAQGTDTEFFMLDEDGNDL